MRKKSNKGLALKLLALAAVGGSVMTSGCVGVIHWDPWRGPGIHIYPHPHSYPRPYRGRDGRYYYRHRHPDGYYYWSPSPKPRYKGKKPRKE